MKRHNVINIRGPPTTNAKRTTCKSINKMSIKLNGVKEKDLEKVRD